MAQEKTHTPRQVILWFLQADSSRAGHCVKACTTVQVQLKFAEACEFFVLDVHTAAKFIAGQVTWTLGKL